MQIRISTALTTEPLTLAVMKHFLKYEEGEADAEDLTAEEVLINSMISSVRILLEKRTGLTFAQKTFEIHFDNDDFPFVIPVYPVISVDEVLIIDSSGTEGDALVVNSGYSKAGMYEIDLNVPGMNSISRLKVTAKAGYGHNDTETLPALLMDAMKTQIFQWYENRDDFKELNVLGIIDKSVNLFKRNLG